MSSVIDVMDEVVPDHLGTLTILDKTGDTKVVWDPNKEAEVVAARQTFETLKAKGYTAYKVARDGEKGEVARSFDPDAAKIILAPAMVGG